MTMKVYIWLPSPSSKKVGHGSLQLTNGTYISWWPEGGKRANPKVTGTQVRTLELDIQDEGRDPDYAIEIPRRVKLDEDAIQSWWDVAKYEENWTVLTNCCWMVEEALKKGGLEKYLEMRGFIRLSHPKQLLALMYRIQAISIATGRLLEVSSTSLSDDEVVRSLLVEEMDTEIMSSVSFE